MKQVTIVVPNQYADLTSIRGAYEILHSANEYWKSIGKGHNIEVSIAGFHKELRIDSGLFAVYPTDLEKVGRCDLLIIPSVSHYYGGIVAANLDLIGWIKSQYKKGTEVASICTGAFLLAATGLLDGKPCATHWGAATDFKRMFPKVHLETDQLITANKGIYTNGGSYSFLNLMLFLVEKYFDREAAVRCSKMFQINMERSLQSPFVIFEVQKDHGDELVEKAQAFIEQNLAGKISFKDLASQLATSRRNFDRRFIKATGNTPAEYVQRVKIEVAKRSFEQGRKSVYEVMAEVGYNDDKAFREVFKKITGLSPLDYKARYSRNMTMAAVS